MMQTVMMQSAMPSGDAQAVMSPAPELCLVKIVGGGALGVVDSGGDRFKNLHNITNYCTRLGAIL